MSVTVVAMTNNINPNQLRRWIKECRVTDMDLLVRSSPALKLASLTVQSSISSPGNKIEITLSGKRRSATLRWSVLSVENLVVLLRDVLA